MNDMVAAFEIRARADQAKAEISQLRGELDKTGTAADQAGQKGKKLGEAFGELPRTVTPKVQELGREFEALGKSAASGSSQTARNLAFQFSQVLQMGQVTGNYMQALAIQIPDMAMGFGTLGIAVGAVAGVALPLLVNWFTSASDSGKELDNTLSEINAAFDAYAKYAEIAAMETLKLKEKFHGFASEVQGFSEYMKGLETGKALDGLSASIDPLKGQLLSIQQTFAELTKAQAALANAQKNPMASSEQVLLYADNVRMLQEEVDAAAAKLGMSADEARQLASAFDDLGASSSFVEIAASAGSALAIIQQIYPASEAVPGPLRDAVTALAEMQRRAAEASDSLTVAQTMGDALMTALDSAAGAASMLGASVPGAGWLDGAISGASRLAAQLWDAARARAAATDTAAPMADDRRENIIANRRGVHDATAIVRDRARQASLRGGGGGGGGASVDRESFDAVTKSAEDALTAMDTAIAAIHEKVALGLMSVSEGEEAITRAKDRAATSIADLIPKMQAANDVSGTQAVAAVEKWRLEVRGLARDYEDVTNRIADSAKNSAQSSFADWLSGAKSGKEALDDFGQHVLATFARIAAQRFADAVFNPIIDGLIGAFLPGSVTANANGGVYSGAGIGAYSGTVVTRPTLFAFAKGTGLMGEAGPEAILPLDRDSSGKLGVRASVSAAAAAGPVINIINQSSARVGEVQERNDTSGRRRYDIVMSDAVSVGLSAPGGKARRTLRQAYGINPAGIMR